jgi:tetratricopeptide (TPR) repeat protein
MDAMPSAESDLTIVSLVRYADSCEPTSRHSDCPFAVEQQGTLTCREECRGVIKSLLRRGRGEPVPRSQAFDARQLMLSEPAGAPDILWHTSSLLQIVVRAARSSPFRRDGSIELRRIVDATSALGALGSRGLDPERILRSGVADLVKLALAAWLGRNTDGQLDNWKYIAEWRAVFEAAGRESPGGYIGAAFNGPVAQHLDVWISTASIEDILMWRPLSPDSAPTAPRGSEEEIEIWKWVVDRFTQTYLDRWPHGSLKREYAFVKGSWRPDFSTEMLAERVVMRDEVATALADRAVVSDDVIDPALMHSFVEQALALLRDGQRTAAATLFNAARMLKPKDVEVQNNYAFCILIDKPEEAKGLLEDVIKRGGTMDPAVSWCNLALAELLLGDTVAALKACEQAYESSSRIESYLWVRYDEGWAVKTVQPMVWAIRFGAELSHSAEAADNIWMKRLEDLTHLGGQGASADPSSTERDGEDP